MVHPKQGPVSGPRSPTGEDAVIKRIAQRLGTRLGPSTSAEVRIGDDSAVLADPLQDLPLLLTADAVVDGVHFDLSLVGIADVGWKALTAAVSDVAAMGGTPWRSLVTVQAPKGTDLDALYEGVEEASHRWGCPVVGGDLSIAAQLVASVFVLGHAPRRDGAVLRAGASPGDELFVTGPLGASAAGLRALRSGPQRSLGAQADLVSAYRRPQARLAEGRAAAAAGATAMMDISDGLGLDLSRMAECSGVGAALTQVPVAHGATLDEALGGGEDFELLIAVPSVTDLPARFSEAGLRRPIAIGTCTDDGGLTLAGEWLSATGYSHPL
ncbi:MAG: thiamine-phosphate kinase [Acidimicrobiales bacterium]